MEPITPQTRLQPSPDVLFSRVGDEAVLLNLASGVYYSLDRVGALVWETMAGGGSLGDVQGTVYRQFSVEHDVLWADISVLVDDLHRNGLVSVLTGDIDSGLTDSGNQE